MRVESAEIEWFRNHLLTWAEQNLRDYPWRRTSNPYSILVAEFLLQRTDADTVLPIYSTFLTQYPILEKLAIAPVEEIGKLLRPLGLFSRAERLSQTARIIVGKYGVIIPESETELFPDNYTIRLTIFQTPSEVKRPSLFDYLPYKKSHRIHKEPKPNQLA